MVDHNHPNTSMFDLGCPSVVVVLGGMGGHPAGDIAAALAAEVIAQGSSGVENEQDIVSLVEGANRYLYNAMVLHRGLREMGTTIAGALVYTEEVIVFWVGDSRVHLHSGDDLKLPHIPLMPTLRDRAPLGSCRILLPKQLGESPTQPRVSTPRKWGNSVIESGDVK